MSRAVATSHAAFSRNHAGRRNATGIGRSPNACSIIVNCVNRFTCVACAPIVDRQTTLRGCAVRNAEPTASMTARVSGNPGDGSKQGGSSTNTPAVFEKAVVSAAVSVMSASATSQRARPRRGAIGVARDGPYGLARGEQGAGKCAADLSGDTGNGVHDSKSSSRVEKRHAGTTGLAVAMHRVA